MATLSRPQLVLKSLQEDRQDLTHETIQVTKTATMSFGTLLKADRTEATATELAELTYDIGYIIDDYQLLDTTVEVGTELTVSAVRHPEWISFRGEYLKLGATALDAGELALFVAGSKPAEIQ